jgi:hypothetical protein
MSFPFQCDAMARAYLGGCWSEELKVSDNVSLTGDAAACGVLTLTTTNLFVFISAAFKIVGVDM